VPSPYLLDTNNRKTVWIDATKDQDVVVDFVNSTRPGLRLLKIDQQTGEPLSGVLFRIAEVNGGYDEQHFTNAEGLIILEGLNPGAYTVQEVKPKNGWVADDTVHTIYLEENKTTTIELNNLRKPDLFIKKVDSVTGSPIEGVKFQVWRGSDDTQTGEYNDLGTFYTDAEGQIHLVRVNTGWYKIQELEPAPGYTIKEPATQEIYLEAGKDHTVTFLDTPGHEAFTAMRARGAMITDVAILVVAADDGIMPQTVESINHAKAAGIPIIVAINKMDKPEANPERIKQQLTEYELVAEEWGGQTIVCPISAKTGMGIDSLLEMVTLTAEVAELKANPNRAAQGTVVEARLDKGRGPVATLLVQNGTLRTGDIIIAGTAVGRVRAMVDDKGGRLSEAGPSVPVEITGLGEVPGAGSVFNAVADERLARELVEQRKAEERAKANAPIQKVSLEDLFSQIQAGEMKDLNIIVKADVQGSAEAVKASLEKLSNEEVRVRVIHSGVGAISESDVMLAATSKAIIVGFNVRPDASARDNAARSHVDMRMYRVIYDAINEVEAAMKGMLAPKFREALIGHAEIRQTYKVSGVGTIAGCYVQDGKIQRNCQVRIVRDGIVIHEGQLASLQRFKDAVKEVASGYECGMSIEKFNDIKEGDIIECFVMEQIEV